MKIDWIVNPVWDGWSPLDTRLGGTEEGVVEWSKRLVQRGHDVTVYGNVPHLDLEGVKYRDRSEWTDRPVDAVINIKCPEISPNSPTWYMTTETDAWKHDLSKYKAVIWPSEWARDNIEVNADTVILPYGYDDTKIAPAPKIPGTVLYASSPDRGLDTLLKVWPEVVERFPAAQLIVTYGAVPQDLPNCTFLGEVSEDEMNFLYATSQIWCHPCNGGELYGITGIKAQAAGCWPVYFPTMALQETVVYGTKSSPANLALDLVSALLGHGAVPKLTFPTWEITTEQLLDILKAKAV